MQKQSLYISTLAFVGHLWIRKIALSIKIECLNATGYFVQDTKSYLIYMQYSIGAVMEFCNGRDMQELLILHFF